MATELKAPTKRIVDHIRSRIRQAGTHGIRLDHVEVACKADASESDVKVIEGLGGWPRFTMQQVQAGLLDSYMEGSTVIITNPSKTTGDVNLVEGTSDQNINENVPQKGPLELGESWRDQKMKPLIDLLESTSIGTRQKGRRPGSPTLKTATVLSRHNHEVLKALPSLSKVRQTEFYKNPVKQDALRLLRAITLLMRFRMVFPARDYVQIMRLLEDEGDVQRLGGLDQVLEMAVVLGYMKISTKGHTTGHVATGLGAALILETTLPVMPSTWPESTLLEQQILENYRSLRPTLESDRIRQKIVKDIQSHLDREFPEAGFLVEMFGSGGNGLYFPGSDSDVCAYYSKMPPTQQVRVNRLGKSLYRARWCSNIETVAHAKIPVIKLKHTSSGLPVDISIENTIAIENTRLIKLYMDLDSRVKPLAFALKVWCKSRAISHPKDGTLSSYSYTLMLIHFLQRTWPPVLPNLQRYDERLGPFTHTYNGAEIDCFYDENPIFQSANQQRVSSLLVGFFRYFATEFDFSEYCVNVKPDIDPVSGEELQPLLKRMKGKADWVGKAIAIEDPFIDSRNTAVGCSPVLAEWIMDEFKRGYLILGTGGSYADLVTFAN